MLIFYVLYHDRILARLIILSLLLMLMIFIDFYVTHRSQNFIKSLNKKSNHIKGRRYSRKGVDYRRESFHYKVMRCYKRMLKLDPDVEKKIADKEFVSRSMNTTDLPTRLVIYIFSRLVSYDLDLCMLEQCTAVCRSWYLCARDTELWRRACSKFFSDGRVFMVVSCNPPYKIVRLLQTREKTSLNVSRCLVLEISKYTSKQNWKLQCVDYKIVYQSGVNKVRVTKYDLINNHIPPFIFSRVKCYSNESEPVL